MIHRRITLGKGYGVARCCRDGLLALYSAWFALTTALDSDERLHSEVGLKQERERTRQRTYARRRCMRSGERLKMSKRRTQRKRQRTVESADDRLERLQT